MLKIKRQLVKVTLPLLLIAITNIGYAAPQKPVYESCVLIDTDFDIDDMMAIPLVIGNLHVAAIVTSEGYTKAEGGAGALSRLIAEPNQRRIPVIIGADTNKPEADITKEWSWLLTFREKMNRANGLLSRPLPPAIVPKFDYTLAVKSAVSSCKTVTVFSIGSYSSFIHYAPVIKAKINKVVMMGKPINDPAQKRVGKPDNLSFNCEYDLEACKTAESMLYSPTSKMNPVWVDIPRDQGIDYSPSAEMVEGVNGVGGLVATGLPNTLKQALQSDYTTWDPSKVSGGKSLLWDQTAALYLLHAKDFSPVPANSKYYHMEPTLYGTPAQTLARVRQWWTEDTNKAVTYK